MAQFIVSGGSVVEVGLNWCNYSLRWQRRFQAQHSVAILERCCNYSWQCRNNMGTLCYAKNRCCESSRGTSPLSWKGTSVRLIKVPFPRRRMCPKNWRPMNRGSIVVFNILSIIKAGGFVSKRSTQAHNANWPINLPPPPFPNGCFEFLVYLSPVLRSCVFSKNLCFVVILSCDFLLR